MAGSSFNYNYNSGGGSAWKNPKPKPARNYNSGSSASSSDDYQKFLEYLENAGQVKTFRRKVLNAHLFKEGKRAA